jgi:cytochrome P450
MIAPTIVIGSISKHLAEDKELQQRLRANPDEIPAAVEEFVRLYVPYRSFSRTVNEEVEISGQVRAQSRVLEVGADERNRKSCPISRSR